MDNGFFHNVWPSLDAQGRRHYTSLAKKWTFFGWPGQTFASLAILIVRTVSRAGLAPAALCQGGIPKELLMATGATAGGGYFAA
jgi:hypothetical protein